MCTNSDLHRSAAGIIEEKCRASAREDEFNRFVACSQGHLDSLWEAQERCESA